MRFLRNVFFVFYCYFCVASAKRIRCSEIVTSETEDGVASIKFTLKIPVENNTDTVSTRVRISGPEETISHTTLSRKEGPKERITTIGEQTEVQYVLTYNASLLKPRIASIEAGTLNHCISFCEGGRDIRPNIRYDFLSDSFSLVGKLNAPYPSCIEYKPLFSPLPDNCGVTLLGRIYGGAEIERGGWPWLAPMYIVTKRGIKFKCGANVISKRAILTAAHCVMNEEGLPYDAEIVKVVTGRHDLHNYNERGFVFHDAAEIVVHPEYRGPPLHDIALINLAGDIEFTNITQPVCLWSDTSPVTGSVAAVAGWGYTKDGVVSQVPLFTEPTIIDIDICKNSSEVYADKDLNSTICAGDLDETGPCRGDSGGGLILVDQNRKFSIRGLVSITLGDEDTGECDLSNYVLYSDVAKYYYWIRSNMW